jgi:hypothetical protein
MHVQFRLNSALKPEQFKNKPELMPPPYQSAALAARKEKYPNRVQISWINRTQGNGRWKVEEVLPEGAPNPCRITMQNFYSRQK